MYPSLILYGNWFRIFADGKLIYFSADSNGLILYNSQNYGRTGDYIALQLLDGVPQFIIDTGHGPLTVRGDKPLPLNTWHTIRLSKTNSKRMYTRIMHAIMLHLYMWLSNIK